MAISVGKRVFAPKLVPTLATLVLLPLFFSLGNWQLHRAAEKRELAAEVTRGSHSSADLTANNVDSLMRYQHVQARGQYVPDQQVLLDNMPSMDGSPGYRVLTPLLLDTGQLLLVDRGWVPLGATREQLPDVRVGARNVRVSGILDHLPEPGVRLGKSSAPPSWPKVLNYPTHADVQALYARPVLTPILLLDADVPSGFDRRRQLDFGLSPQRHIAYAVQWFAFAVTLLVMYIALNLKAVEKR